MASLIYSPGIKVVIDTIYGRTLDVTADVVSGQMRRVENGVSSLNLVLANEARKYDRMFTPNDRISVQLKRVRWLQSYVGYLDSVPYFSAWSRSVSLSSSCSLKRVQFFPWDPYSAAAAALLNSVQAEGQDMGLSERARKVLTEVVGWQANRIHIGEVPQQWFERISNLYDVVQDSLSWREEVYVGSQMSTGGGDGSAVGANVTGTLRPSTIPGVPGNPATGSLPHTRGKISAFGGPNGGAYGVMNLTLESGRSPGVPEDPGGLWYAAMRFQYMESLPNRSHPRNRHNPNISMAQHHEAKAWWKNRRILVRNPKTGKMVVLRCADWGPAEFTGRVLDVAPHAERALGAVTDDVVDIAFAPEGAPLGPYTGPTPVAQPGGSQTVDGGGGSMVSDILRDKMGSLPGDAQNPIERRRVMSPGDQTGMSSPQVRQQGTQQVPYPIPSGISGVKNADFAWGGHQNGRIPDSALSSLGHLGPGWNNARAHPLAAEALQAMVNAAKQAGITLKPTSAGDVYRTLAIQQGAAASKPHLAARAGTSIHGWGCAIDLTGLGGFSGKGYRWLAQNAHRFGFTNPPWAQQGGSKPEHWHWEFWGIFNYVPKEGGNIPSGSPNSGGTNDLGAGFSSGAPLFNAAYWNQAVNPESEALGGPLALINDEPVMSTLKVLMNAAGRSFCSAPNGDFLAWFPDYFGIYGTAGRLQVEPIELLDFTLDWSDLRLKTHQYVTGALHQPTGLGGGPGGPVASFAKFMTHGVASIEYPELMEALFDIGDNSFFADSQELLYRFGARIQHTTMPNIAGREAEFWYALHLFQKNWTEQWSAKVPTTFLPEAYPGMLMQIKEYDFQAYIREVVHTWNFNDGGGFSTQIAISAPSSMGSNGLLGALPKAGTPSRTQLREGDV